MDSDPTEASLGPPDITTEETLHSESRVVVDEYSEQHRTEIISSRLPTVTLQLEDPQNAKEAISLHTKDAVRVILPHHVVGMYVPASGQGQGQLVCAYQDKPTADAAHFTAAYE
ncbi:hypothetical protein SUNI508_00145 [Seiridium unicorne]|uniref:Uncharacterized protein n=1 Tax=Seiridium unicorne TaxID=138068 RepID=A0ABR2VI53_9PEZI